MRKYVNLLLVIGLVILISTIVIQAEAAPALSPDFSTASELIDAVNSLRAEKGLYPYTVNPILMSIAQTQAEYVASIGVSTTHIDAFGRLPYQRALDAGYAVAGGWYFSENVVGGISLTAVGAVEIWMGDAPHQGTMLSAELQDVGAGVGVSNNTYYYVLDAGRSTGGIPAAYTPGPSYLVSTPTMATNTPGTDGTIIHIVQTGDTLLAIAIAYDISLDTLYTLNGFTENSIIYPGQSIIVRAAYTPTSTSPSPTPTIRPSSTPWPKSSSTAPLREVTSTATLTARAPSSSTGGAVIAIVVAALIGAAFLTMIGARKKSEK